MSTRALRKLQREQAKQPVPTSSQQEENVDELDDNEDDEIRTRPAKSNLFDMLHQTRDTDEEELPQHQETSDRKDVQDQEADQADSGSAHDMQAKMPVNKKSRKKRKKKGKGKENPPLDDATENAVKASGLDEIDAALQALNTNEGSGKGQDKESKNMPESDYLAAKQVYSLLATDTKNLNALNEMKRLFGNAILEEDNEAEAPNPGRRRGRGARVLDLGGALAGQNSPVSRGKGLVGLALRRNVFMLGKEEWPKATSGGLGMEVVEKPWDHTTEYRFVHSAAYQDAQKQFESCVESLDPQRLIQHLQFNRKLSNATHTSNQANSQYPAYHISTLLQVSEIAKQQGDHSVSGDLLERALFSFGRSVHSSFPNALAQGEARLDFRRPENREFWLAVWRYIANLGQRGTWRTAYEWAKLLLSLDPEGDPYQIRLIIDQLALRGGQFEQFLSLANTKEWYAKLWASCPNIQISKALAEHKLKRNTEARRSLETTIMSCPWIFARMFRELNIDDIPRSIWGKQARNEREAFECEVYVTRAKDIWNTPEATSFLVDVVKNVGYAIGKPPQPEEITLDEARHILLSGVPPLIGLLPRKYTTMRTRASDPLPPPDDLPSYGSAVQLEAEIDNGRPEVDEQVPAETSQAFMQMTGIPDFITRILPPWLVRREVQRLGDEQASNELGQNPQSQDDPDELPAGLLNIQEMFMGQRQHEVMINEAESYDGENDEDDDSMPELEDFDRDQDQPGFDMYPAADAEETVEDDNDNTSTPELEPVQPATQLHTADPSATTNSGAGTASISNTQPRPPTPPYDEDQNKRWLAGRGLMALREFVQKYSTNEESWWQHPEIKTRSPAFDYAHNIIALENRATKNFIFNHALPQGTSTDTKDLITRFIADIEDPFISMQKVTQETEPLTRWLKTHGLWWLVNWEEMEKAAGTQEGQVGDTQVQARSDTGSSHMVPFTYARYLWVLRDDSARKEILDVVLPLRTSEKTQNLIKWLIEEKGDLLRENKYKSLVL